MRNLMETNPKTAMPPATIASCNVTLGIVKSLGTPHGMLLQIELLVIFAALLLLFLVACGSTRRHFNSKIFRVFLFAAYTLSTYIVTFTLGLMQDAPLRNELFPLWAMFLMLALGSADSISAYSLKDNEQWRSHNWQLLIKSIWLVWLMSLYFRSGSKAAAAVECLFFILVLKSDEKAQALMAASRHSLERNTKVVADYMSGEHERWDVILGEVDPMRMRGYTYLVRGEEERWLNDIVFAIMRCRRKDKAVQAPAYRMTWKEDELITIEKVWKCEGRLLSSEGDPDSKLKDICLSFALFKLLRLRYAHYPLPQQAHEKTWNLIRYGLLSQEDGYERVFRVAELELMFLFDFFYTKYSIIFQPGWLLMKFMEFTYVVIGIWAMVYLLKHYKRPYSNCQLATMPNGLSVDLFVTSMMILLFIIVEIAQFVLMAFSEWAKVTLICKYVQKKSWQEKAWMERMISFICRVQLQKPWERRLRQYSFLESYTYKPLWLLNNVIMAAYYYPPRDGQQQSNPIQLPKEVKQAVFDALKSNGNSKLENGKASLRENVESPDLLWACSLETDTQVIMVWHIATGFCQYLLPVGKSDSSETRKSFLVATSLSKYLAYLVAFAPRLLPDHPYVAEHVFDQAIIEAKDFFQGCESKDDRVAKMERKGRGSSAPDETVINRGARLGNQLVNDIKSKDVIWRILANFWVELMLYVSPSDAAVAHAEQLTKGGEFVTHLWALLSHAGIKRDHPI